MHKFNHRDWSIACIVALSATSASTVTFAESHVSASNAPDEIIVSVRKKDESLQEVPISVDVLTNEQINRRGVYSLDDITRLTPSLVLDGGFAPQDTRVVIRGLAPTRGRPNVAFLQDGIDISSEALITAGSSLLTNPRLFDLERVEVVKGPQSALYGRSAFAGGINYVTKRPGDEVSGTARIDVSNENAWQTSAGLSGPVIEDKLNMGVNIAWWDEDGHFRNSITGGKVGDTEGKGISTTALYTPTDSIEFFARLEYSDDEFGPAAQATVAPTETLPVPSNVTGVILNSGLTDVLVPQGRVPDRDELVITLSEDPRTGLEYPGTEREIKRFSLIGEFNLNFADLTWFSHLADTETGQFQDAQRNKSIFAENPPGSQIVTNSAESILLQKTDLISQELRLSGQGGPIEWATGVLYWREEAKLLDGSNACFTLAFPASPDPCAVLVGALGTTEPLRARFWERDTKHWSVYADIDWNINEQWLLGFEIRFAEEDLNIIGPDSQLIIDPSGQLGGTTTGDFANNVFGELDDDYSAPKVTLQWTPSDEHMFYASIAKGVKPAGISTIGGGVAPFVPDEFDFEREKVVVYEVGNKATLANGKLILNSAVFYQDFTDKQVSTQVDISPGVIGIVPDNAGAAEVWGVEIDATWFLSEKFTLSASYTRLDGEYTLFTTESTGGSALARAGNCTLVLDSAGDDICELDLSGRKLEGLPKNSFVGTLSYRTPINSSLDMLAEIQTQYQSKRYQSEFNVLYFDDFWLTDLKLGVQAETWEVIGYIDNFFDDETIKSGFVSPDFTLFSISFNPPPLTVNLPNQATYNLSDPRTVGIRASMRF